MSAVSSAQPSTCSDAQAAKRPRYDGKLPSTREEVDQKLKESAECLQEWSILLDRTEKCAASDISKTDLLKHVTLKRKLHENLGILARLAQIHTTKAKLSLQQQQQLSNSIGKDNSGSQPHVPQQANLDAKTESIPAASNNNLSQLSTSTSTSEGQVNSSNNEEQS